MDLEHQRPPSTQNRPAQTRVNSHRISSIFAPSESFFVDIKSDISASVLEFLGTIVFLLLGLGGIQAASAEQLSSAGTSPVAQIMYISCSMGFSLLTSAWLFFRVTGGLFNPNVSLALLIVGVIKPVRFVLYCLAQMLAAIVAAGLVRGLTSRELAVNNVLAKETSPAQGVFIECFTTSALILSVLLLAAEKHKVTPFAPVGIGLTLFACHLFATYYTGACMNTARAFGPAVISGFPAAIAKNHWVYWLGPFLGSLLSSAFYYALKYYHYENLTPGQAATNAQKSADPVRFVARTVKAAKARRGPGAPARGRPGNIGRGGNGSAETSASGGKMTDAERRASVNFYDALDLATVTPGLGIEEYYEEEDSREFGDSYFDPGPRQGAGGKDGGMEQAETGRPQSYFVDMELGDISGSTLGQSMSRSDS